MKRLFAFATLVVSMLNMHAQLTSSGYYRVYNYGSKNYVWVCDNTGKINYAAGTADMGAMQLWPDLDRSVSEPASVLYFDSKGSNKWDIRAQGTGIHKIINHNVEITPKGTSGGLYFYELSATQDGLTAHLSDDGKWSNRVEYTSLGTKGTGTYRRWIVVPIDVSTDNYFGIKPTLTVGDKHYAPFYAEFPFSFASTGMKAYYVSKVDGNIAVLKEVTADVVPASTPVLIECSSADKSNNRLNLLTGTNGALSDNLLKGVYFCNEFRSSSKDAITPFDPQTMRVWNVNAAGKLVLSTSTDVLHSSWFTTDTQRYLNANQSYLTVTAGTPEELVLMTEEEYNAREIAVTGIALNSSSLSVFIGDEPYQLTATVSPSNATDKSVVWTSSSEDVASVDATGLVTFKALGQAVITATANDGSGVKATCSVEVKPVLVNQIVVSAATLDLNTGETATLTATISPANATDKSLTWSSSDASVATVDADGVVKAIGPGTAVITVKAVDASGLSATCTVTVVASYHIDDVNQDGTVDTQDVLTVYEYMQNADPSETGTRREDVNQDGVVDTQDVLTIYEYMQGQ